VKTDAAEPFDVLDAAGHPTGATAARDVVHRDGLWHAALHVWIVDATDRVWLQRRSDDKDLAPGKVDVAVGGHLAAGETWVDALREADEELGLPLAPSDVEVLGVVRSERRYPHATDREVQTVAVHRTERTLADVRLPPDEVAAVYAASLPRLLAWWRDDVPAAVEGRDAQGRPAGALLHAADRIEEGRAGTLEELALVEAWGRRVGLRGA